MTAEGADVPTPAPIEIVRVKCPHREGLAYRDHNTLSLLPCDCNEPSEVVEVAGVSLGDYTDLRDSRNEWRRVAVERKKS